MILAVSCGVKPRLRKGGTNVSSKNKRHECFFRGPSALHRATRNSPVVGSQAGVAPRETHPSWAPRRESRHEKLTRRGLLSGSRATRNSSVDMVRYACVSYLPSLLSLKREFNATRSGQFREAVELALAEPLKIASAGNWHHIPTHPHACPPMPDVTCVN